MHALGTALSAQDAGCGVTLDLRAQAAQYEPALPPVGDHNRPAALHTWRGRMVNESGSAAVFEGLAEQFRALEMPAEARTCLEFAAEERHHGVLCGAVVQALGGEATAAGRVNPDYPLHPEVAPLEALVRNLLHISCLSETIAVALIGAEREEMPEGALRALLTRIWADECGHANFGWRTLPKLLALDPTLAGRMGPWLQVAFADVERHELEHLPSSDASPDAEGAALGLCSGPHARGILYATLEQVVVPALEAQGMPARQAWETRSEAAPG